MQAAARVLEYDDDQAFTTNRVAEYAGVSIGSLYQYYPTKEAILAELIRRMRREMHDDMVTAVAAVAEQGMEREVDALLSAALQHHLRNSKLAEALEQIEPWLPLDDETAGLKRSMVGLVAGVLARNRISDPEATACDLIAIGHGLSHALIAGGLRDFAELHRRMRRAIFGYLRQEP